jgi:hypothetical protein
VLNQARSGRKQHVGRNRPNDDGLKLGSRKSGAIQGFASRFAGDVRGRDSFIDKMTLANSGAFLDPLVIGFDHLFEVGISQKARWDVGSKGADFGPLKLFQACLR